jgi:hypothetical protein
MIIDEDDLFATKVEMEDIILEIRRRISLYIIKSIYYKEQWESEVEVQKFFFCDAIV